MSQLRVRCAGPGCRIVKPPTLLGLSGLSSPHSLPRSSFARRRSHEMATLPEHLGGGVAGWQAGRAGAGGAECPSNRNRVRATRPTSCF